MPNSHLAPDRHGYILSSNREATPSNIDELSSQEVQELTEIPVTAYDHLRLRANVHRLVNVINNQYQATELVLDDVQKGFTELKEMLTVELPNGGTPHKMTLGQAFTEMYERETQHRHRYQLWKAIKQNKVLVITIGSAIIIGIAYFTNQTWFLSFIVPFIVYIIKLLIKK